MPRPPKKTTEDRRLSGRKEDIAPEYTSSGHLKRRSDKAMMDAALLVNNYMAAGAKYKGVTTTLSHAWFSYNKDGLKYLYNGNDGQDGIDGVDPEYEPNSSDSSPKYSKKIIRVLLGRDEKILQFMNKGCCYMVSAALSRAYYEIFKQDYKRFNAWAMNCTESDCYFCLKQGIIDKAYL
jgi:hypothetical protein